MGEHTMAGNFGSQYELPKIIGSLSSGGISWLQTSDKWSFTVCTKGHVGTVQYNWLAIVHKNPQLWYRNRIPYSGAGSRYSRIVDPSVTPTLYNIKHPVYTTLWSQVTDSGAGLWKACDTVPFERAMTSVPQVMVSVTANAMRNGYSAEHALF